MTDFQIGVMIDSFKLGLREGIRKAKDIGASGIQISAVRGKTAPENLNAGRRKAILDEIRSNGLVVSAVMGDLGGHGFARPVDNAWKIEKSKRTMDLALDLDTHVITTHIGVVPDQDSHPRWKILQEACENLGAYGDQVGAYFAIETGPRESQHFKTLLRLSFLQGGKGQF